MSLASCSMASLPGCCDSMIESWVKCIAGRMVPDCGALLWDSAWVVDEQFGPSTWLESRLESLAHLKRCLAGVPCAVSVSCLQSIQHAAGACNGFLQVTPSGRILENADFHMGWWVHSAPCSAGGRGRGFAAVLPLADKTKKKTKKNTWTPAQRPYVPYFPNTYTQWWVCVYRDVSPTSWIHAEVRMRSGHSVWAKY